MIKKKKILFGLIFSFIGIIGIFIFSDVFKDNVKSDTVSIYLNNETADSIPLKNEAIFSKAICDDDVRVLWDNDKWGLLISNMTNKVKCNLYFYSGPTEFDFDYTGDVQTFTAPVSGTYKIAAWGASGGDVTINDATYQGGLGGYTSGLISLEENQILYIYVGGFPSSYAGGYNGGAQGGTGDDGKYTGGGGATDIRINNGNWNNFDSLKSRIMVAAGGAGTGYYGGKITGGSGGGLIGYDGQLQSYDDNYIHSVASGGTQTSGGSGMFKSHFGYSLKNTIQNYGTGGGSGYYGGGSGRATDDNVDSGAGGSSFISGHNGCDAIKKESAEDNIIHTGRSIHYSGLYFTNTVMIDGNGYNWTSEKGDYIGMPSHSDNSIIKGNHGNGYVRITMLPD